MKRVQSRFIKQLSWLRKTWMISLEIRIKVFYGWLYGYLNFSLCFRNLPFYIYEVKFLSLSMSLIESTKWKRKILRNKTNEVFVKKNTRTENKFLSILKRKFLAFFTRYIRWISPPKNPPVNSDIIHVLKVQSVSINFAES